VKKINNSIFKNFQKFCKDKDKKRQNDFMPNNLVESHFAILEIPDACITLDGTLTPDEMTSYLTSIFK